MVENVTNFLVSSTTRVASNTSVQATHVVWNAFPVLALFVLIIGSLSCCYLIVLFFLHPQLRTPFNVYIINMVIANLLNLIIQAPLYLVNNIRPFWWLGRDACTVYMYAFVPNAVMINSHLLVTINRLWAVFHPISYRRYHSRRTAIGLCVFVWVYVHAVKIPGIVIDLIYYRKPEETFDCVIERTAQPTWSTMQQMLVFKLPVLLIIMAYPVIAIKVARRSRVRQRLHVTVNRSAPTNKTEHRSQENNRRQDVPSGSVSVHPKPSNKSFWFLTVMTASVVVCMLSNLIIYTPLGFVDVKWPTAFLMAGRILGWLENLLDPILFALTLPDLRDAVLTSLRIKPASRSHSDATHALNER